MQVAKKIVRGDYKSGRVQDPTAKLSHKHEKSVKKFVKEFMDKAVAKKVARDKERAARAERKKAAGQDASPEVATPKPETHDDRDDSGEEMDMSDDDEPASIISPTGSSELKRKREEDSLVLGNDDQSSPKKFRTDTPPAPPPPPPPPAEDMPTDMDADEFGTNDGSESVHTESGEAAATSSAFGKTGQPSELAHDRVKQTDEMMNGHHSPMQLATPPTTTNGSCEHESNGKDRETASLE